MAAGTASRFVPLSEETPKGLLEVRGEILIERQIRQLRESGIQDITVVLGYKAEMFEYLAEKFCVKLVFNEDYKRYNNTSSVIRVLDKLDDTFICCSDHYFERNVFLDRDTHSYYAIQYAEGETAEWCVDLDSDDLIKGVHIGGSNSWYLAGHAYFNPVFSKRFKAILEKEYQKEETRYGYWEDVLINHLSELPIRAHQYNNEDFREFDSIDELRTFDSSYIDNTRSSIVKAICSALNCKERELSHFKRIKHEGDFLLFAFKRGDKRLIYDGSDKSIIPDYND